MRKFFKSHASRGNKHFQTIVGSELGLFYVCGKSQFFDNDNPYFQETGDRQFPHP